MRPFALSTIALFCFATGIATGCGGHQDKHTGDVDKLTAAALRPPNEIEQGILVRLETEPQADAFSINGSKVRLGAPYFAASGAVCRAVTITAAQSTVSLACRKDSRWFFAPEVFASRQEHATSIDPAENPQ